MRVKLQEY